MESVVECASAEDRKWKLNHKHKSSVSEKFEGCQHKMYLEDGHDEEDVEK